MAAPSDLRDDTSASPKRSVRESLGVLSTWIWVLAAAAIILWSFFSIDIDFSRTLAGMSNGAADIGQMFPHSLAIWRYDRHVVTDVTIREAFAETIQMAVVGTVSGALLALPISFLAARTGSLPRWFTGGMKTFLNVARAVPTIVYALIAVSSVGLGMAAGATAIAVVSFIGLAKLYAEALESVSPGPVEAVRAVGGNSTQVFVYGMLPQVFPHYLATTLFTFEYNIKDSFIVGIVGAGGLGQELMDSIHLLEWRDAGVIIALLIVLINIVDNASYRVRRVFS